jgi:hypothetical protein
MNDAEKASCFTVPCVICSDCTSIKVAPKATLVYRRCFLALRAKEWGWGFLCPCGLLMGWIRVSCAQGEWGMNVHPQGISQDDRTSHELYHYPPRALVVFQHRMYPPLISNSHRHVVQIGTKLGFFYVLLQINSVHPQRIGRKMKIAALWDVVPFSPVHIDKRFGGDYWHHHQGGGNKLLWTIRQYLPDYMVQHPTRQLSSYLSPWEP